MNITALWDQLVASVCRPPRDIYEESDLIGGRRAVFRFGETQSTVKKYYRQDKILTNPATGHKLQCSHFRPCIVPSEDGRMPCVIYCHTNSGSRRDCEEILFTLLPKGVTVFALDFAGSGLSDGEYVTLGAREVEDLAVAVQYLREEGSCSTLGLWGRSMGAVTALLYAHRDPSIAAVVVDSPFSKLVDLMLELATDQDQGLNIPRPLVKVALAVMRRSVRKRAGFNIDAVAPIEIAPEVHVPALFGHGEGDTFVQKHHSQRLYEAYGGESKNIILFEGDHNGMRPDFWYDSALIFLLGAMGVDMEGTPTALGDRNRSRHQAHQQGQMAGGPAPVVAVGGQESQDADGASEEGEGAEMLDDEAALQRALELSLQEAAAGRTSGSTTEQGGEGVSPAPLLVAEAPRTQEDEEAMLAQAIAESLRLEQAAAAATATEAETPESVVTKDHAQESVQDHAEKEAHAVRAASLELHDALVGATVIAQAESPTVQETQQSTVQEEQPKQQLDENGDDNDQEEDLDEEDVLQKLREATAKLTRSATNTE